MNTPSSTRPPHSVDLALPDDDRASYAMEDVGQTAEANDAKPSFTCQCKRKEFKVTVWRALNSLVIIGFGTAKAILAYNGSPAANGADMALGMVWAFIAYWCCILEEESSSAPWLFEWDIKRPLLSAVDWGTDNTVYVMILMVAIGRANHPEEDGKRDPLMVALVTTALGVVGLFLLVATICLLYIKIYCHWLVWSRSLRLFTPIFSLGYFKSIPRLQRMDGMRRRCMWMLYVITVGLITILIHPFPLTAYINALLAVFIVNIATLSASYIAIQSVSLALNGPWIRKEAAREPEPPETISSV
ncbi:hypothetical protein DFP72DRAFT_861369 [Ephemerocybe angulata]|uniref:Uncharacterized protein n=1 Tax=Ephemerocybe angulata TaxID=980116 RepID=A0A8H6H958_9AGAR|nr:hypothetical protein DFP72DRAFT_861369 [Tulosesus angulatus]